MRIRMLSSIGLGLVFANGSAGSTGGTRAERPKDSGQGGSASSWMRVTSAPAPASFFSMCS